eukprot:5272995-Prymnesium_polylepis.1
MRRPTYHHPRPSVLHCVLWCGRHRKCCRFSLLLAQAARTATDEPAVFRVAVRLQSIAPRVQPARHRDGVSFDVAVAHLFTGGNVAFGHHREQRRIVAPLDRRVRVARVVEERLGRVEARALGLR